MSCCFVNFSQMNSCISAGCRESRLFITVQYIAQRLILHKTQCYDIFTTLVGSVIIVLDNVYVNSLISVHGFIVVCHETYITALIINVFVYALIFHHVSLSVNRLTPTPETVVGWRTIGREDVVISDCI